MKVKKSKYISVDDVQKMKIFLEAYCPKVRKGLMFVPYFPFIKFIEVWD